MPGVASQVLFAVLTSTQCSELLYMKASLTPTGDGGFNYNKRDVMHNSFRQDVVENGVVTISIRWLFEDTKTIKERIENAVRTTQGEKVTFKVTSNYGAPTTLQSYWRFSDSANPTWTLAGGKISADDGVWGAANSNVPLNGNGACLSGAPNPKYGVANCNAGDSQCSILYTGTTSKSMSSSTRILLYAEQPTAAPTSAPTATPTKGGKCVYSFGEHGTVAKPNDWCKDSRSTEEVHFGNSNDFVKHRVKSAVFGPMS